MRAIFSHEKYRILDGPYKSTYGESFGAFRIGNLVILATDGAGVEVEGIRWEHVSVSTRTRCPTWPEMEMVKRGFWKPEETVIQFHPAKSEYINYHEFCLHLWRPIGIDIPLPPKIFVGPIK